MKSNPAKHGEQSRIARHLQTEFYGFLQSDGGDAGHGADAQPVRHRARFVHEAASDRRGESDHAHGRRKRQQETAFGGELQVVVVSFGVATRPIVLLV
ncbi:MAG TPA: hypothetical protein VNR64_09560, partial [Vicinamibacterales bacterium]|nr:hypothetical protein [Vicinamibacterales bacterium]